VASSGLCPGAAVDSEMAPARCKRAPVLGRREAELALEGAVPWRERGRVRPPPLDVLAFELLDPRAFVHRRPGPLAAVMLGPPHPLEWALNDPAVVAHAQTS
jgi:hypothetical protein